jgi:hypothetical protein
MVGTATFDRSFIRLGIPFVRSGTLCRRSLHRSIHVRTLQSLQAHQQIER